jgi:hypothetical protein
MFVHRRCARPLAVAFATAAVAVAPSAASARPMPLDPPASSDPVVVEPAPVVREVHTGGDTTLAIILSGAALLVAAGGAGVAGRSQRRLGRIAGPQA